MRRAVVISFIVLLLSSIILIQVFVPVQANPFLNVPTNKHGFIRSSGVIDPSTLPIQRNGDNYFLTGNIVEYTLEIQRSGISLDGAGFTIQGVTGFDDGITLSHVNDVTIKNLKISRFFNGIVMNNTSNIKITNNCVVNSSVGVLSNVSNSEISGNTFYGDGLDAHGIPGQCTNCLIIYNYFDVGGISLTLSNGNSIADNFFKDPRSNCICLDACNNNIISGNTLFINHTFRKDFTYTLSGINLWDGSAYNSVFRNNVIGCHSSYDIWGIEPVSGINRSITIHNVVSGIMIDNSSRNVFYDNDFSDSEYGVYMDGNSGPLVLPSGCSDSNTFFSNNFSNLTTPFCIRNIACVNNWDNRSIGNYWSDYRTIYPQAQAINDSLTGDTPYVLNSNNIDRFPLINPANIDFSSSLPTPISPPAFIPFNDTIDFPFNPTPSPSPSPTIPEPSTTIPEFPTATPNLSFNGNAPHLDPLFYPLLISTILAVISTAIVVYWKKVAKK